ncbi:MAG: hypothetical protein EZS28_020706 [Streblomastix strix]|uniref:Rad21/Rec8-like protein N-terminal domain-containing protein n=1 Tax=Streblomastix strix TaxID=222440 RepID=A0A5J4VMF2_9EUKA|nr:MAG: hypothetical protein EZS28_020706 [Streblomastix strix]
MVFWSNILSKNGKLGKVWLAANYEKGLSKNVIARVNVFEDANYLMQGVIVDEEDGTLRLHLSVRISANLMLGLARILTRQIKYLSDEVEEFRNRINTTYLSASINLPPETTQLGRANITLPDSNIQHIVTLAIFDSARQGHALIDLPTPLKQFQARPGDIELEPTYNQTVNVIQTPSISEPPMLLEFDKEQENWAIFTAQQQPQNVIDQELAMIVRGLEREAPSDAQIYDNQYLEQDIYQGNFDQSRLSGLVQVGTEDRINIEELVNAQFGIADNNFDIPNLSGTRGHSLGQEGNILFPQSQYERDIDQITPGKKKKKRIHRGGEGKKRSVQDEGDGSNKEGELDIGKKRKRNQDANQVNEAIPNIIDMVLEIPDEEMRNAPEQIGLLLRSGKRRRVNALSNEQIIDNIEQEEQINEQPPMIGQDPDTQRWIESIGLMGAAQMIGLPQMEIDLDLDEVPKEKQSRISGAEGLDIVGYDELDQLPEDVYNTNVFNKQLTDSVQRGVESALNQAKDSPSSTVIQRARDSISIPAFDALNQAQRQSDISDIMNTPSSSHSSSNSSSSSLGSHEQAARSLVSERSSNDRQSVGPLGAVITPSTAFTSNISDNINISGGPGNDDFLQQFNNEFNLDANYLTSGDQRYSRISLGQFDAFGDDNMQQAERALEDAIQQSSGTQRLDNKDQSGISSLFPKDQSGQQEQNNEQLIDEQKEQEIDAHRHIGKELDIFDDKTKDVLIFFLNASDKAIQAKTSQSGQETGIQDDGSEPWLPYSETIHAQSRHVDAYAFASLLAIHSAGYIEIKQDVPYGEIKIRVTARMRSSKGVQERISTRRNARMQKN